MGSEACFAKLQPNLLPSEDSCKMVQHRELTHTIYLSGRPGRLRLAPGGVSKLARGAVLCALIA